MKKKFLFLRLGVGRILYTWSNCLLVWLLDSSFNTLFVFGAVVLLVLQWYY